MFPGVPCVALRGLTVELRCTQFNSPVIYLTLWVNFTDMSPAGGAVCGLKLTFGVFLSVCDAVC